MGDMLSLPGFGLSQYYSREGAFGLYDPRTRLLVVFAWLCVLTATASVAGLCAGLLLVVSVLWVSRIPAQLVVKRLLRSLIFVMILIALQVLFTPPAVDARIWWEWRPVTINSTGLVSALKLLLRFCDLYLLLNWMTCVLSVTEIVRAMDRLLEPLARLRIPTHDLVLLIQVALHFLPLFSGEIERIAKAQASRGASWGTKKAGLTTRVRQTLPILLPLFITSLRRAENLAQAIEARGYGAGPRTSMVTYTYQKRDALALPVALTVCGLIL
ncbi:MAG: energy-coupling factor transporter transmembrane component T, partial [Anaerolineae bacterium]|nr:energy-coupling factor transporter transmembrane component T [Anaerolineae bacterium]